MASQFSVGDVVQGFGLHNAGRFYTVLALGRTAGRIRVREHLSGRDFWTFDRWVRLVENEEPNIPTCPRCDSVLVSGRCYGGVGSEPCTYNRR